MAKVAESWNNILQMSEQDLDDARGDIARLEDEIEVKSRQLRSATDRCQEQQSHIKELEDRWNQIEAAQADSRQANEDLNEQVNLLRTELAKSQARVDNTSTKCKDYRVKINEAIAEQQELYKRSKTYYDNMVHRLKAEKEKQTKRAAEVDVALEASQKKREEMRKVLDHLQAEARKEMVQKDERIKELGDELLTQHANLLRERSESEQLRGKLEQAEGQNDRVISGLGEKVDALAELCQATCRHGEQQSEDMSLLFERLQATHECLESCSQNAWKPQDMSNLLASVEERIVQRIEPQLDAVHNYQKDTENTAYRFNTSFNEQLSGIKDALQHHFLSVIEKPDHTATITSVVEALSTLQKDMASTRQTCSTMQDHFEGWTRKEINALEEAHKSREGELLQDIHDRYESLSNREHQLQNLMEEYSHKVEQLTESRNPLEETENLVQLVADRFKNNLEETLVKEREWLTQKLNTSEEAMLALEERLRNPAPANLPDVEGLQRELEGERAAVVRLTSNIQKLQKEATSSERLRKRWLHEMEQVESLRAKLSAVHPRMQRVEGIAAKLDSINRLNGLVHSTATYLTKEKSWIKNELEVTAQGMVSENSENHPPGLHRAESSIIGTVSGPSGHDVDPFHGSRRVFVRSPWQDSEAPSPPPDVVQEQRRRREAAKPRPILRFTGRTTPGTNSEMPSSQVLPKMESQTSLAESIEQPRPADPWPSNNKSTKGFVDRFGGYFASGIQGAQKAFTTLAEFEQASNPVKKSASQELKPEEWNAPTESIHKISERFKEHKDTSPGDLKMPTLRSKRAAPADLSRPLPPLKRVQRRQTMDM